MITRCDQCGSIFEVSEDLVYSSDPQVRCGECLSLFNAQANLFNEAQHRKSAATLRPVQKRAPAAASTGVVEADYLETADTVAVEHFYSAGASSRNTAVRASLGGDDYHADRSVSDATRDTPSRHRPASYPADIEFERTVATEAALPDNASLKEAAYQSEIIHEPARSTSSTRELSDADAAEFKRQNLRDRERRALQIEPDKAPYEADVKQGRDVGTRDSHFIPEDVLERAPVVRNRRGDEQRSNRDTPEFSAPHEAANPEFANSDHRHHEQTNNHRESDTPRWYDREPDYQVGELDHLERKRSRFAKRPNDPADGDTGRLSSETSAQEMRRFQRDRPSAAVKTWEENSPADRRSRDEVQPLSVQQPQSKVVGLFWLTGLIMAAFLLLFAARGFVANLNLPEPVISTFCQITGCAPTRAQKDVGQLRVLGKQLYPHPEIDNALAIRVEVLNISIYKQPLPTVVVSLINAANEPVAERGFNSTDYDVINESETDFLMPGEPAQLTIELVDTGLAATDVELAFE